MTAPRNPSLILPVAVTLTVLLGLYVGGYYVMVRPRVIAGRWRDGDRLRGVIPQYTGKAMVHEWIDYPWLGRFFSPIHWLDRRIRPHIRELTLT